MTPLQRGHLGRRWAAAGLAEHASVAAFAQFVLDLMSVGAPPDFVSDACEAMKDEVRHARACFATAARFLGEPVGPGPWLVQDTAPRQRNAARILNAAIREGCVVETVAAHCVALAHSLAEDDQIQGVLESIEADEMRHADLSWRFVRWMLETTPKLTECAHRCFLDSVADLLSRKAEEEESGFVPGFGLLNDSQQKCAEREAIERVVLPRWQALLAATCKQFAAELNSRRPYDEGQPVA